MRIEQSLGSVRARIVWLTLIIAWALSFLTSRETVWLDWVALVLLFWTTYQPARIALWLAFAVGLFIDIQQGSVMGIHALLYIWAVSGMRLLSSRLQFSSVFIHALYGTGVLLAMQLIQALVRGLFFHEFAPMAGLPWVLLAVPAWLLLARLLYRGASSNSVSDWVVK